MLHMKKNVLPELLLNAHISCFCKSCACNGLPCVECAGSERFFGLLGPAMHNGVRVLFTNDGYEYQSYCNMMNFLLCRRIVVKLVKCTYDLSHLERTRFTPSSAFSVI